MAGLGSRHPDSCRTLNLVSLLGKRTEASIFPFDMSHALVLSPGGHLFVESDEEAEPKLAETVAARLRGAFGASTASGLEFLAGELLHLPLPSSFAFWRGLAQQYFTALCHNPSLENPLIAP